MTPSNHLIKAKRKFGQNFLTDDGTIENIVRLVEPKATDYILEIGPGTGVVTEKFLDSGATVLAIEIDNDLVDYLRQRFAGYDKFLLKQNNFLHFDLNSLLEKSKQWKVVGNLPYNVATPMIFHLLSRADIFSKLILMTQLEVAERIVAKPNTKAYGRLSILLQRRATVTLQYRIESSCFYPTPKVQSAIIELIPKTFDGHSPIEIQIEKITREAFNRRRKTIANSLNTFFSREEILLCELDPSYRAEALSIKDYEKLGRYRLEQKCSS